MALSFMSTAMCLCLMQIAIAHQAYVCHRIFCFLDNSKEQKFVWCHSPVDVLNTACTPICTPLSHKGNSGSNAPQKSSNKSNSNSNSGSSDRDDGNHENSSDNSGSVGGSGGGDDRKREDENNGDKRKQIDEDEDEVEAKDEDEEKQEQKAETENNETPAGEHNVNKHGNALHSKTLNANAPIYVPIKCNVKILPTINEAGEYEWKQDRKELIDTTMQAKKHKHKTSQKKKKKSKRRKSKKAQQSPYHMSSDTHNANCESKEIEFEHNDITDKLIKHNEEAIYIKQHILSSTWYKTKKVIIFARENAHRKMTLSLEKSEFIRRCIDFIKTTDIKLIPIKLFGEFQHLFIMQIDKASDTDIGVSFKYTKNGEIIVTGFHLDGEYIRSLLIVSTDSFKSNISHLRITGKCDAWYEDKYKKCRAFIENFRDCKTIDFDLESSKKVARSLLLQIDGRQK